MQSQTTILVPVLLLLTTTLKVYADEGTTVESLAVATIQKVTEKDITDNIYPMIEPTIESLYSEKQQYFEDLKIIIRSSINPAQKEHEIEDQLTTLIYDKLDKAAVYREGQSPPVGLIKISVKGRQIIVNASKELGQVAIMSLGVNIVNFIMERICPITTTTPPAE